MDLLLFSPADLHQRADLDGSFTDRDFAAQQRRLLQGSGGDDTKSALAHVVNKSGDCGSFLLGTDVRQGSNGDLEVLGEPRPFPPIAFGSCLHANLSLREVSQEVHSSDGVVPDPLSPKRLRIWF